MSKVVDIFSREKRSAVREMTVTEEAQEIIKRRERNKEVQAEVKRLDAVKKYKDSLPGLSRIAYFTEENRLTRQLIKEIVEEDYVRPPATIYRNGIVSIIGGWIGIAIIVVPIVMGIAYLLSN